MCRHGQVSLVYDLITHDRYKPVFYRGTPALSRQSYHISGIIYLSMGQTITLRMQSTSDTSWTAQGESGMSIVRLDNVKDGFSMKKDGSSTTLHDLFSQIKDWRNYGSFSFNMRSNFNLDSGVFTAELAGYYICHSNVRLDNLGVNYARLVSWWGHERLGRCHSFYVVLFSRKPVDRRDTSTRRSAEKGLMQLLYCPMIRFTWLTLAQQHQMTIQAMVGEAVHWYSYFTVLGEHSDCLLHCQVVFNGTCAHPYQMHYVFQAPTISLRVHPLTTRYVHVQLCT